MHAHPIEPVGSAIHTGSFWGTDIEGGKLAIGSEMQVEEG